MNKIGLFGMYGLYNYGCEAIVRGTYGLIKEAWPHCEVVLYTYTYEEDQKIIGDLDVKVKEVPMKSNIFARRVINKVLRMISVQYQLPVWDSKAVAEECDVVFSVGGDIYTISKHILNNKKETSHSSIIEFGKTVLKYKPFVIWGASIGPFGHKPEVKSYYFDHLKDVKQIFCREEKTYNYLKSNEITYNVQLCPDPGFFVKSTSESNIYSKGEKIRIALNLSSLSIKEQVGENHKYFIEEIIETILDLLSIPNTEVVLVPHVISPLFEYDNDLTYLREIFKRIPKEYKDSVRLLEDVKGFLGTKEFLRTCDVVVASRMHCCVNAVCEGIPTIFLTYSQKGIGMANYIYGNTQWSIPLLDIKKELKSKTVGILSDKEVISENIKNRIEEIRKDEHRIVELFRKLI